MHSSTSNSDYSDMRQHSTDAQAIEYRHIPDHGWHKQVWLVLVLLIPAILLWEWLSREMDHTPGTYHDGFDAMWAEERRKLDKPDHDINVVIVGSSRILWASDLNILEEQLGTRPLQLALPGTSPALIMKDIVDNTDYDGLMLVGVTPGLFNWLKEGAFGGKAFNYYHNETPSMWVGTRIFRWLSDHFAFLDHGFSMFELIDHYWVLPERKGAKEPQKAGWKLGNMYKDRQTDMWAPVEIVGSFDNKQNTMFWAGMFNRPPLDEEGAKKMKAETVEFFNPVLEKFRTRGGDVVFIMMPDSGPILERYKKSAYEKGVWEPMIKELNVPAINTMAHPDLSTELDIPEWSHFSRESQDEFSRRIIPYINKSFQESRGMTVLEYIESKKK